MRLVCPNCGAQYEVDDRVVPEGGRDVQCSNCGHAWFQRPQGWEDSRSMDDPDATGRVDEIAPDDPPPEPAIDPIPEHPGRDDKPADETEHRPRRPLDDNVRGILTEEAERELQARATEGVESQPDLGISEPPDPTEERRRIARERMARMRGVEEGETLEPEVRPEPPAPEAPPAPVSRKDLFPDIEEINSTLDTPPEAEAGYPSEEPQTDHREVPVVREKRSGFRRGFSIIIIFFALALGVYVLAPEIVKSIPALEPAMIVYVDFVNGILGWIEDWMQVAIEKMETAAGGDEG